VCVVMQPLHWTQCRVRNKKLEMVGHFSNSSWIWLAMCTKWMHHAEILIGHFREMVGNWPVASSYLAPCNVMLWSQKMSNLPGNKGISFCSSFVDIIFSSSVSSTYLWSTHMCKDSAPPWPNVEIITLLHHICAVRSWQHSQQKPWYTMK